MNRPKRNNNRITISIIGVRAFPSEFAGTSGVEVYVEKTVRELVKNNRKLRFIIYTRTEYQPKKIKVLESIKIKPLFTVRSKVLESFIYSFFASLLCIFDSSSVVWYQGVGPGFFFFLPKLFGKKVILTVHSLDWERRKWTSFERFLFRNGAAFVFFLRPKVFTVSKKLKAILNEKFRVKATYAPPGIDLLRTRPPVSLLKKFNLAKNSYLLFLGRFVPEKRIEWLTQDYLNLRKRFDKLKLVIAGGHGNLPEYEEKLRKEYKDSDIIWAGYVFGEEKLALLSYCRLFVLPSELEGNSVSLMEALGASAYCVVGRKSIDNLNIVKLGNVFVFSNDKNSFIKAMLAALARAGQKYKYGKEEVAKISKYTWINTAKKYTLAFYDI